MSGTAVIGRGSELALIARFLDHERDRPAAIVLEGEAGIGKTTLWEWAIDGAINRGRLILQTRAGASEATMSFTALGDLLEPVIDDVLEELPPPQRRALDAALLRADPETSAPDRRAVSLALLGALRIVARERSVLVAIDDLQWLDAPSANVLGFAVRRLRDEPIGILASVRIGEPEGDPLDLGRALPEGRVTRLLVGSMSPDELGKLIRERLGADLSHPVTERVDQAAGGNPFFAVEIARELVRRGVPEAGEMLPITDDLRDLLRARLETLPKSTRAILLASAATARPTEELVRAASGLGSRAERALARAIRAGVVSVKAGLIRFTHPLLASAVYASASLDERRDMHRRLAGQVEDREEVARHLALAAPGPDADVASALDQAASIAGARGAPQSAAELSDLARRLTPAQDVGDSIRRTMEAAAHHFDAGDDARAKALMEEAIGAARTDDERARPLFRLASVSWMDMRRVQELSELSLDGSPDDSDLLAAVHCNLAWVNIYRGDLAGARRHSEVSMSHAGRSDDPAIRADVFSTFGMVESIEGRPAEGFMAEAMRLHHLAATAGLQATTFTAPPTCRGLQLLWSGELAAARDILEQELKAYEEHGRYIVRDEILVYLAELECRAGNWDLAGRYARESQEIDVESGRLSARGHTLFPNALIAAHRGDVDRARSQAEEGLSISVQCDDLLDASCHRAVLGFLELSLSDPAAAMRHLEPALQYRDELGAAEPGFIPCVPDAVEALVALGRADEADPLVERLDEQGRALDRPWARATALRCRGLLLGHHGDSLGALEMLELALEEHALVPQPLDRARTILVKGEVERRAKQKKAARSSLEQALGMFEELGASLWSTRARNELDRIGGRPPSPDGLTGTERQVAELVAEGKTNTEVAGQLFMSIHTVRSNLRRIYGKLGVRHRSELASKLRGTGAADTPQSDQ